MEPPSATLTGASRGIIAVLRSRLAKGAASAFVLQVCSQALTFTLTILLARVLGRAGLGVYSNANAWVQLLVIPATLGMNQLIVREVAKYSRDEQWGLVLGLFRWASRTALLACAALAIAGGITALLLWAHQQPVMFQAVLLSLVFTLPLTALTNLRQAAMRGLGKVATGLYPDMVVRPVLLIALVAALALFAPGFLTPITAVALAGFGTFAAFLVGSVTLSRTVPVQIHPDPISNAQRRAWLASALSMLFLGGVQVLTSQTATIVLGATREPGDLALFAVASRGAAFIPLAREAINIALAPMVAQLYSAGRTADLQRLVTRSSQVALTVSLLVALFICVFAKPFLLLFGRDFPAGIGLVWGLSIAQVVSAGAGSVGLILVMTGHERVAVRGLVVSAALTILLSALLIPRWGPMGAVIADGSALAVVNLIWGWSLYRTTGLLATALPVRWLRPSWGHK